MQMRFIQLVLLAGLFLFEGCIEKKVPGEEPIDKVIDEALAFSLGQSLAMARSLETEPDRLPKTLTPDGRLETCRSDWWVSGFFPGVLWYLYEYSHDELIKNQAIVFLKRVEKEQFTTNNHDVGFIIFCSFGNGFRISGDTSWLEVIHNAAQSLSTRYRPEIGVIRSWDKASWNHQWQYPVIIDNMMNLELLLWTAKRFNEPRFYEIAVSHADKTMENHYRDDFSCFHVVSYDTLSGAVEKRNTSQGYSDSSAWARGQSWGLYGYTMLYRETGLLRYLEQAQKIADFLIDHPRLPDDKIPYWDYDAPDIPFACRDASAAAIMCSALIELSRYVPEPGKTKYLSVAEQQIRILSSPAYRNQPGKGGNFLLNHSVGHFPNQTEVDVPLSYTDYYYVEALMRFRSLKKPEK